MHQKSGFLGNGSCFDSRYVPDYEVLAKTVESLKGLGQKVVLTQGTYDLLHIGHAKYLECARSFGDFLIVGIDSDEKTKSRKGEFRPMVPEDERLQMLCHLRSVDLVTLKQLDHPRYELIRVVQPDVLVVSESTKGGFPEEELKEYESLLAKGGRLEVLPPQAETSASARIRIFQLSVARRLKEALDNELKTVVPTVVAQTVERVMEERR